MSTIAKQDRILTIFYRLIQGENINTAHLAQEFNVSMKSIKRDISDLRNFMINHRFLFSNQDIAIEFDRKSKTYSLMSEANLRSNEFLAIVEVLIGSRAFRHDELIKIIEKIQKHVSCKDRKMMNDMVRKEIYHYQEVYHDCHGVIDQLWSLSNYIENRNEISIDYYRMDRKNITRRIRPMAIIFSEYYFYLVAYHADDLEFKPVYYRIDRIIRIVLHRKKFVIPSDKSFDEGELRKKIQFMWPGVSQKICFEFSGPSVQAILDRIPTAKVVSTNKNKYIIEAEVYGNGIKMFLMSQGAWVKILSPESLVKDIKKRIRELVSLYEEI